MWRNGYKRPNPDRDREMRRLRDQRKREVMQEWFHKYKASLKCELCTESHPATLDFHHRDSGTKFMDVGVMIGATPKYSKQRVLEEIAKCIVICANCHRKLHWEKSQV